MKRIATFLLSLVMIISLCTPAFASESIPETASIAASSKDLIVLIPGTMGTELKYHPLLR